MNTINETSNATSPVAALIPLSIRAIGQDDLVQTVNGRDLHSFLEVGTAFKDWIVRRIQDYDFKENFDFSSYMSESTGGRPSKEYAISLDMAKELSMVERTEKGKVARTYFIQSDNMRRANEANQALTKFSIPETLHEALFLASTLAKDVHDLRIKNEQTQLERDEAIRTKAHIGSKREAQAMAAASVASRKVKSLTHKVEELKTEVEELEIKLDENMSYATIKAIELSKGFAGNGKTFKFGPLKRFSEENGIPIKRVPDVNYGEVNAYHRDAWANVYGVSF
jgi:phage anti-repressor protein